eukprot:9498181-Pyramimonas_sp.AAC.1
MGTAVDDTPDFQRSARALGYRVVCSPSFARQRGSSFAAVAIFVKQHVGIRWNPDGGELVKGRLMSVKVDIPGRPGLT